MWIAKDREPPTPEHFDEHYLNAEGAHLVLTPDVQTRLDEVLEIVGDVSGKRILDLGGGALLCRSCKESSWYTLVDMSKEGCRIASQILPKTHFLCMDVLDFLMNNRRTGRFMWEYDVTVAIGLVEYLQPIGMDTLFRLCPSSVLAFTTAVKEAYLKYEARVTVPTREEVAAVAEKYGWRVTKELPRPDHVWARYERVQV